MSFTGRDAAVRQANCARCGEGCPVDHGDPCAACYRFVWNAWGNCSGQGHHPPSSADGVASTLRVLASWAELHQRALGWQGGSDGAWLVAYGWRLPCGECRRHWQAWVKTNPPTWSDYFGWTVGAHNAVNQRLGRPILSVEAAFKVWSESA